MLVVLLNFTNFFVFLVLVSANPIVEHHTFQLSVLGVSFDAGIPLPFNLILQRHQSLLVDIIGIQSFKGLMNILVYVSVINLKSCSDVGVISFDYRRLVSLATGRKL